MLDIPGFDGNVDIETTLQSLRTNYSRQTDLVIYCISMDAKRWPKQSEETSIRRMIDLLGPATFLKNRCVYALTFADQIIQSCPAGQNVDEVLRQKQNQFEEQILKTLKKYLPEEHLPENLPIAPIFNQPCAQARYKRHSSRLKVAFFDLVYTVLHTHLPAFSCFYNYFRQPSIQQDDNSSSNEQVTESNCNPREPDTSPSDNLEDHNGGAYCNLDNDLDDDQSAFMRFIKEVWEKSPARKIWNTLKELVNALREHLRPYFPHKN